jgi:hypothetical protein
MKAHIPEWKNSMDATARICSEGRSVINYCIVTGHTTECTYRKATSSRLCSGQSQGRVTLLIITMEHFGVDFVNVQSKTTLITTFHVLDGPISRTIYTWNNLWEIGLKLVANRCRRMRCKSFTGRRLREFIRSSTTSEVNRANTEQRIAFLRQHEG